MSYETIILEKNDNIATITLNRPDRLNAISPQMTQELASAPHMEEVFALVKLIGSLA